MLLSMTGHGDAAGENERISVAVEVRSVNNRHLKVTVRCPDAFASLESQVERVVRQRISRGTLNIQIRVRPLDERRAAQIDRAAVRQYWTQLLSLAEELSVAPPSEVTPLLALPGIIEDDYEKSVDTGDWPLIEQVLEQSLASLDTFRRTEGESMATELASLSTTIQSELDAVSQRAPLVVVDYRERLKSRVNDLLQTAGVQVDDKDLIREVSLFADRCDITEEITRLRSHLQQYASLLDGSEASGRRLEFLGQEMFREINTIGSKANDIEIAHRVVEMKAAIEKMREIIQNIE